MAPSKPVSVRRRFIGQIFAVVALIVALASSAGAQTVAGSLSARPLITEAIDATQRVTLAGNTRPEAKAQYDSGAVPDDFPMAHMMMQLRRSPEQQQALETLIDQLHDPASPFFHQWLTAEQIGARFGLAVSDLQQITSWLTRQGFELHQVYPSGMLIDFSGTAGQVRAAFGTPIHRLSVDGETHFANMGDPQIPAALSPAVIGIVSLHDFRPQPQVVSRINYTFSQNGTQFDITPADLATIYNLNALFNAGLTGQGQTVTIVEPTDVFSGTDDWNTFRSTFGLSQYGGTLTTTHPNVSGGSNCQDPGTVGGDELEAGIDVEWASAAAPAAAIVVAACANSGPTGGFQVAVANLVNGSSPPTIISSSYGICEANNGAAANAAIFSSYQQGVMEGISIFVASGDQTGAYCDKTTPAATAATHGINVNGHASTPYNVAVGGTDYSDYLSGTTSTYWNSSNSSTFGSAKSYVPEIPWNNTCGSALLAKFKGYSTSYGTAGYCNAANTHLGVEGGSGGPSTCAAGSPQYSEVGVSGSCQGYAKPSYQSGLVGVPNDGLRDLPDVSIFASTGFYFHAYIACMSDTANGGSSCAGAPSSWNGAGGTSFGAPIMSGIQALVNQHAGAKQGNPNTVYYALAKTEYGASGDPGCNSSKGNGVGASCIFYDVTSGDNNVPCLPDPDNGLLFSCYRPSGTYGVLFAPSFSNETSWNAGVGWDYATGIGSVNAYNLVTNWPNIPLNSALSITVSGSGTVTSADGAINCGSACSANYISGRQISLSATPANGWSFVGWSGACGGASGCTVTMNGAQSATAVFQLNATPLTVSVSGNGSVTSSPPGINCGSTCSANYASGAVVSLTQSAASGAAFAGWSGACSGVGTCIVTMSQAQSVTGKFASGSPPTSPLVAAVLPASRSATVGNPVTAFATIINGGSGATPQCAIAPEGDLPLNFVYQTTNPATNGLIGTANTPVDIAAGQAQSFVIALTPTAAFAPVQVPFSFACSNVPPAPIVTGLNTLLLSSSTTPVPDIVALAGTASNDGILHIPGASAAGAFAVATVNVGAADTITATANTGSVQLPLSISLCETDPASGQCITTIGASAAVAIAANATPTFAIFGQASGAIPFDPANNRIVVQFTDSGGTVRGATSVAVETQ
jgi:subtilase family serine protease